MLNYSFNDQWATNVKGASNVFNVKNKLLIGENRRYQHRMHTENLNLRLL